MAEYFLRALGASLDASLDASLGESLGASLGESLGATRSKRGLGLREEKTSDLSDCQQDQEATLTFPDHLFCCYRNPSCNGSLDSIES